MNRFQEFICIRALFERWVHDNKTIIFNDNTPVIKEYTL
jgi:hypothetical protein